MKRSPHSFKEILSESELELLLATAEDFCIKSHPNQIYSPFGRQDPILINTDRLSKFAKLGHKKFNSVKKINEKF